VNPQNGDTDDEHDEGNDDREDLVKSVQEVRRDQLVEDERKKETEDRECDAPLESSLREVVSTLVRVNGSYRE